MLISIIPYYFFRKRHSLNPFAVYVYPVTASVCTHMLWGRVFGSFSAIGNSVLDLGPLRQLSSIFGILGITFIVMLLGSALALSAATTVPDGAKSHIRPIFLLISVLLIIGGFLEVSDRFYERSITALIVPTIPACLMCV
jgi:apolipoprotein N-acyltransferase